jgi:hypothetical protein
LPHGRQRRHISLPSANARAPSRERASPRPTSRGCDVDRRQTERTTWILAERIAVTPDNLTNLEGRNKKLVDDLGSDNCQNIDRIMRVPFTVNYPDATKRKRGRIPVRTSLIADLSATMKFDIERFASAAESKRGKEPPSDGPRPTQRLTATAPISRSVRRRCRIRSISPG